MYIYMYIYIYKCKSIGPPLQSGFYYDTYMGTKTVSEEDLIKINVKATELCSKKYTFQRFV
jgi:threonyl-tRNA synthetase